MDRTYQYRFETGEKVTFNEVDYIVFGATLLASASIGMFYAIKDRRNTSTEEFLLGGRDLHYIPVSLSLLSSFISAITLLGTPAEVYRYNTMYWWIAVGFIITALAAAHVFIPVFYNLNITSTFQYVEMRFGKITRFSACILYLAWMLLYMGIVLYGPSLALNAVTGLDLWGSIFAVGLVCIFYTTMGGMKAVVWTDSLQMVIMFAGMITLLIFGSNKLGGFDKAWNIANENGRILFLEFDPDPSTRHTVWTVGVGGGLFWSAIYGINQAQVQRAISVRSVSDMRKAIWLNFPGMFIVLSLVCSVGVVMYAYYSTCDPVTLGIISKTDQLIPLFTMDLLGHLHGLPGLVMSCIFSGSLSTISSGLNAVAAVILEDFAKPFCCQKISQRAATIFSKATVIIAGLICLGLAFLVSQLGAILQAAYVLFGILGGPLLGLFTLGMLFPWANKWGGLIGHYTALVFLLWVGLGTSINGVVVTPPSEVTTAGCYKNSSAVQMTTMSALQNMTTNAVEKEAPFILYRMSYMWYAGTGILVTVVVGLIVSFITGATKTEELDPRLICPFFDIFFPCLPKNIRRKLWFGVRHDLKDTFGSNKQGIDNKGANFNDIGNVEIHKNGIAHKNGDVSTGGGFDNDNFSTDL